MPQQLEDRWYSFKADGPPTDRRDYLVRLEHYSKAAGCFYSVMCPDTIGRFSKHVTMTHYRPIFEPETNPGGKA